MKKKVTIKNKYWCNDSIFGFEVSYPGIKPQPGQFFHIRVNDGLDPFLNRPISIASYRQGLIRFIVKVVGRGTRLLSQKKIGDPLFLLGPLGTGVRIRKKSSLLLAGGIGVAPLFFLAQSLHKKKIPFTILYGVKKPDDFILRNELKRIARKRLFVTEQGRRGQTVISALSCLNKDDFGVAYACGPRAMLKQLQQCALPFTVHVFCEDFLGCGCGLCLGCAIKFNGVYRRICEDGPVFELNGIEFQ